MFAFSSLFATSSIFHAATLDPVSFTPFLVYILIHFYFVCCLNWGLGTKEPIAHPWKDVGRNPLAVWNNVRFLPPPAFSALQHWMGVIYYLFDFLFIEFSFDVWFGNGPKGSSCIQKIPRRFAAMFAFSSLCATFSIFYTATLMGLPTFSFKFFCYGLDVVLSAWAWNTAVYPRFYANCKSVMLRFTARVSCPW